MSSLRHRVLGSLHRPRLGEWLMIGAVAVVLTALLIPPVQWAASGEIVVPVRVIVFDAVRGVPLPDAQVLIVRSAPPEVEGFMADLREREPFQISEYPESHRSLTDRNGIAKIHYSFRTGSGNQHPIPSAHLQFYWVVVQAPGYRGVVIPLRHESMPNSTLRKQGELIVSVGMQPGVVCISNVGEFRSYRSLTPTGSRLVAQSRLRSGRPWVSHPEIASTPTGLRQSSDATLWGLKRLTSMEIPGFPAVRATLGYGARPRGGQFTDVWDEHTTRS